MGDGIKQRTEKNEVDSRNAAFDKLRRAKVGKTKPSINIGMLKSEIFNLLTAFCHLA